MGDIGIVLAESEAVGLNRCGVGLNGGGTSTAVILPDNALAVAEVCVEVDGLDPRARLFWRWRSSSLFTRASTVCDSSEEEGIATDECGCWAASFFSALAQRC
jgi:hypothetical protein